MVNFQHSLSTISTKSAYVSGEFIDRNGSQYYKIAHSDKLDPFLISLVSSGNHWAFIFSNGALSSGRIDANHALFPYATSDKLQDTHRTTGPCTLLRVTTETISTIWQPFKEEIIDHANIKRNVYKSIIGNQVVFEEIHLTLGLVFSYQWSTSKQYGFIRHATIKNLTDEHCTVEVLDGLQNIMSAGVSEELQTSYSNLVDAYKWNELTNSGLGLYTIYSGVSDKAEPVHSFHANCVYALGLDNFTTYIGNTSIRSFIEGTPFDTSKYVRGKRGAYFIHTETNLSGKEDTSWYLVADVHYSQSDVATLEHELLNPQSLLAHITASIATDQDELQRIIGRSDGVQHTNNIAVDAYHFSNTVFNCMRGGIINDQYYVSKQDFISVIQHFNTALYQSEFAFLTNLPDQLSHESLLSLIRATKNAQLERLAQEYLPITFGRRHGDPSRPWNKFNIKITDNQGNKTLYYEGNWRDIFQNWEALLYSYPQFINNSIAKFVNNSTIDGYNPYRISKDDIDWEAPEEGEWCHIGYWGDHQIIYLLKLLELSVTFNRQDFEKLLLRPIFSYANVPYKLKPFDELVADPKHTIIFDYELDTLIQHKASVIGKDAKMLLTKDNEVIMVTLIEKMIVTMLAKVSNLVINGGIWLNTQRPEWNDANNAIVGNGVSMVTLYYLRRYVVFFKDIASHIATDISLSVEVADWLRNTLVTMNKAAQFVNRGTISNAEIYEIFAELGQEASSYRMHVYEHGVSESQDVPVQTLHEFLDATLASLDFSIHNNTTSDGLYHTYNLINIQPNSIEISHLYTMLEGQVAALSSNAISYDEAASAIERLFTTALYRTDQESFILYPNRELPSFLDKNIISAEHIKQITDFAEYQKATQECIFVTDTAYNIRFHADIVSEKILLDKMQECGEIRDDILSLYRTVFKHNEFTGRSGTMFSYEGLGSVYWHMVSKLLITSQELFFNALADCDSETQRLGKLYYQLRRGLSFNKTPLEYGAFPTDPYSHSPEHSGAQQPGMTGQVKEWVLLRFNELGIHINEGTLTVRPQLLKSSEFLATESDFSYYDVLDKKHTCTLAPNSLVFTFCQIPFVYCKTQDTSIHITIYYENQRTRHIIGDALDLETSKLIFARTNAITKVVVDIPEHILFSG